MKTIVRKVVVLVVVITLLASVSGCWNRREMSELAIAIGLAIDKSAEGVRVTVQVVDPGEVSTKQGGGGDGAPVTSYSSSGKTLFQAIRKLTKENPRKTYFSHLKVLVVSEELARDGLREFLDLVSRDQEFRTDFVLLVAENQQAEDILKILTGMEKLPMNKVLESLKTSSKVWAPTVSVQFDEFLADLLREGKHPVASGIRIVGDKRNGGNKKNLERIDPKTKLMLTRVAVFKNDRLVGWLTEEESKGYNYAVGHVRSTIGVIACPNKKGNVDVEIIKTNSKIKMKTQKGRPTIEISIEEEVNLGASNCQMDLLDLKNIQWVEKKLEERTRLYVSEAISTVQHKYRSDIFGFGRKIRQTDPDLWRQVKPNWEREFAKIPVQVKVKVEIRRIGTTNQTLMKQIEE